MIFYKEKIIMIYLIYLPISFCLILAVFIFLKRFYIPIRIWNFYTFIFLLNLFVYKISGYIKKKRNNKELNTEEPKKEISKVIPKKIHITSIRKKA